MNPQRFACLLLVLSFIQVPNRAAAQQKPPFKLAPALALEAEDFKIDKGWRVLNNGAGNYMNDIIGFCHISGERLLAIDEKDETASAVADITVPAAGDYRLWVRYEYPAFCETRFRVAVEQAGRKLVEHTMGAKDNPRYAFGDPKPKAQHDPSWGPEGLMEEVVTVTGLKAGGARIHLMGSPQPQIPGVAAKRHIDFVYLTADTKDAWMPHYRARTELYPILDAFRDSRGPRYEARFTNRGAKPASYSVNHTYNRLPWGADDGTVAKEIKAGAATGWIGLRGQDTCHYHLVNFNGGGQPFDLEIRPVGGAVERTGKGADSYMFYIPPYPGRGDKIVSPIEQIDNVLKDLATHKAPGKAPTQPLCYGGWMPLGQDNEYGRKYAQLYAALGMRSLHPANSGPAQLKNLQAAGVPPSKSWMVMGYRNPPTAENVSNAKKELAKNGMAPYLLWYDYGDEIHFSEWMGMRLANEVAQAKAAGKKQTPEDITGSLWRDWLKSKRPAFQAPDYWMPTWGAVDVNKLKPDSSARAATAKPKLYVDSILFYEEAAIAFAAAGAKQVRQELGAEILCGANYSCHPFYYPSTTMYIKWFRDGAADMGRHSEYFWQVAQPGPMINGYVVEHFRAGMRHNPRGVIRQYTMPHMPGNTDANFTRTAFSHLAHGAKMLDFFGIGMNETFTENHIDHRAASRFRAVRDVTHAIGFVDDLLPQATVVPSPVALLVSESTERWDFAGVATDQAGHNLFGPDFRKTRLHFHLERLGLWKALTFQGVSPDLVIEDDLQAKILDGYKVLMVVGDCLPADKTGVLEAWVKKGGVILATSGAGAFDSYRDPNPKLAALFGVASRDIQPQTTFFRPRQELPFLKPLGMVAGSTWEMPVLAVKERVKPGSDVEVLASFKDDKGPTFMVRKLGNGKIFYTATLPGVAYLWSALQPPVIPDRGPATHSIPTAFDAGAQRLLRTVLEAAAIDAPLRAEPALIDARILKSPKGYIVPIANYHDKVRQSVTLSLRLDGKITKATSAYHGQLPIQQKNGRWELTLSSLGYGDMLRLE